MNQTGIASAPPSWYRLPRAIDGRVVAMAWVCLVVQIVVIGTGGLVRLTASGLGCPTWPECTAGSLVTTPEMGIHGIIEFGNRMLTGVVVIVVIAMFLLVIRMRHSRPELWWLSLAQGIAIPVQAVIGGISVLTNLNPYVVGLHFVVSAALVSIASRLVYRSSNGPATPDLTVPRWYAALGRGLMAAVGVTVVLGILTTGSGPHAGALTTTNGTSLARTGFNPAVIEDLHAIPAFITFALTLVLLIAAARLHLDRRAVRILFAVEIVQIVVGITQALNGLPFWLVGIHMVLAALLIASTTAVVLGMHRSAGRAAVR